MILIYFFIFVFGAIIGSFINCIVYRLELQEAIPRGSPKSKTCSFLRGRSFCPKCEHTLGFWDLIPVISFVMLKGKCRYCKKPISWHYPVVELAMAGLLILNFKFFILNEFQILNFKTFFFSAYLVFAVSALVVIFIYDLKHFIIPDKIIFPAIGAVLVYRVFEFLEFRILNLFDIWNLEFRILKLSLLAGLVGAGFFFLIWFISRGRWMGFGDVKLGLFMGLFLTWPNILVGLFFSFLIGAIIGLGLIIAGKKKMKSMVPFGPFLIIGTFVALFFGQQIISFYAKLCL